MSRIPPSSCSPAGSPTSGTCRCAPAAGSPRRCATRASRSRSATSTPGLLPALRADPPACVLPMLHGETGEDGAIREVLELLGVPYVGSGPAACRIAFDKPVAKAVVERAGLTTPASVCLPHETFRELGAAAVMDALVARLGPAADGQAGAQRLGPRVHGGRGRPPTARRDGERLRLRRRRAGRALRRRRRGGRTGGRRRLRARGRSRPSAIQPDGGGLRLHRALHRGQHGVQGARPSSATTELAECARVAVAAHEALGLRDLSRSDLIVDDEGDVWFLEVNVAPGLHRDLHGAALRPGRRARPGRGARRAGPASPSARDTRDRRAGRGWRHDRPPLLRDHRGGQARVPGARLPVPGQRPRAHPPQGGAVLAVNHISYVDFIYGRLPVARRRLARFMAKREIFDHRVTGPLMRACHHIEVDRADGGARWRWPSDLPTAARSSGSSPRRRSRGHGDQGAQDRRGPDGRRGRRAAGPDGACGAPSG